MKLFRQTWSLTGIIMMIIFFTGCTANNDGDPELSHVQPLGQEHSESEDTETEEIPENFTEPDAISEPNMASVPHTIAGSDIRSNAEQDAESTPNIITDPDEPVAVSQLDYDSLQSQMTDEEWAGFEQYFPILKENADFKLSISYWNGKGEALNREREIAKEGETVLFYRYAATQTVNLKNYISTLYDSDEEIEMLIREIRVCDLTGDGIQELILNREPSFNYLILHCENGNFYGWETSYRGLISLQTNGIFISSSGAGHNYWHHLYFDNGFWLEENLASKDSDANGDNYCLHGEEVDEDVFLQQINDYITEDVTEYKPKQRKNEN